MAKKNSASPSKQSTVRELSFPLALALGCTVLLSFGAYLYAHHGEALLQQTNAALADNLIRQARQLAENGSHAEAITRYTQALQHDFESEQDRIFALKSLGTLLWREGRIEEAVVPLREAAASDYAPSSVYEPLAEVLFSLKAYEEAETISRRWLRVAGEAEAKADQAAAWYQLGRLATERGEKEKALDAFKQGAACKAGGRNACDMAFLYYKEKNYEEALHWLDEYLKHGAQGERAAYARTLHTQLKAKTASPSN